jgi:predicted metal-dependent hydrolase
MALEDYTLRYSKKAKHLQLRVSHKGVEVIIPVKKRLSEHFIRDFILQKQDWILTTQQRYALIENKINKPLLPSHIHLLAIDQMWDVSYIPTHQRRVTIHTNAARQIKLMGNITNENTCKRLLKQWLKHMAEQHLCEMLKQMSDEVGIPFHQVTIRNNTTRWGSCTSHKNISLCCRLLFLPAHLVRHVLLHELSHTKVMHHGAAFWNLLEKLDQNTKIHVKELKRIGSTIPEWVG